MLGPVGRVAEPDRIAKRLDRADRAAARHVARIDRPIRHDRLHRRGPRVEQRHAIGDRDRRGGLEQALVEACRGFAAMARSGEIQGQAVVPFGNDGRARPLAAARREAIGKQVAEIAPARLGQMHQPDPRDRVPVVGIGQHRRRQQHEQRSAGNTCGAPVAFLHRPIVPQIETRQNWRMRVRVDERQPVDRRVMDRGDRFAGPFGRHELATRTGTWALARPRAS